MKRQSRKKQPTPTREPAPDWVKKTPYECDYYLIMYEGGGDSAEQLEINRNEFLMLKHVLAASRGYDVSESDFATTEGYEDLARRLTHAIRMAEEWAPRLAEMSR